MSNSNVMQDQSIPCPEQVDGLLPAFSARVYSQLPTPQSPNTLGRYLDERPNSPETPVPHSVASSSYGPSTPSERHGSTTRKPSRAKIVTVSQPSTQQYATPESSPQFQPPTSSQLNILMTPRNLFNSSTSNFATPQQTPLKLESPAPRPATSSFPLARTPISSSPIHAPSIPSSTLSSPFMGKISLNGHSRPPKDGPPITLPEEDPFLPSRAISIPATSTSSVSPPNEPLLPPLPAGGEMDRIRQARLEERMSHIQEAERRRPDYMKRTRHPMDEAPAYDNDMAFESEPWPGVGVTESPQKGRRLKLFQETSDESFEESLMAGGYGRYRTAEWVRQPQPLAIAANIAASATSVSPAEAEEVPPSERELKKRKRLAAFQLEAHSVNSKLCPVELEGKGRVLLDTPSFGEPNSPEPSPSKRKATSRRRKRLGAVDKKGSYLSGSEDDQFGKPNWPDSEFPWKVRADERIEEAKTQKEERMKWIERYFDRDSDDEDDEPPLSQHDRPESSSAIHRYHGSSHPHQARPGRGKSIPLAVAPDDRWNVIPRLPFPVDPGDARDALLSKKSVRTLSYRHQKRLREVQDDEEYDEQLCICRGKDDGRQLVQCDSCQTWYHLDCIGIASISELGREEDPWFCDICQASRRSPSTELEEDYPTSEPILVPTEPTYIGQPYSDLSLLHPFSQAQPSPSWLPPRPPRTPTRGTRHIYSESSRTILADPTRHPAPSTPQRQLPVHRSLNSIGTSDALNHNAYPEEPPFDPMSTPSRGLKFSAWPRRPDSIFQTPLGTGKAPSTARLLQLGHSASADEGGPYHFGRVLAAEESPIRRNRSSDATFNRRRLPSPLPRSQMLYEDSPVVRAGPSRRS